MKVYLAGGFQGEGRRHLIECLIKRGIEILDPATHGLSDEKEYTRWDMDAIDRADCIIAFMEPSNPSGFGLNFEVGYAVAMGRRVIFLDLMGDDYRAKYFGMVRATSTRVFTVEEAIELSLNG